ncbi:MAG TPA: polymer-forming cytoskeletal protein [Rhizomicrobium sp.]|jgi:cytoskeletal protein CcmA (bactofilin family)
MFTNRTRDRETSEPAAPAPAQAVSGKRPGRTSAPSIISSDLVVNGTLTSTGDIQIDGRVEGDVHSVGLVIGEKALILGDVLAEDVTIRGRVNGGIRARKVLLCSSCHVEGNILHEAFAVEAGAFFEGNCRHSDNPLAGELVRQGGATAQPSMSPVAPSRPEPVAPAIAPRPAAPADA